jgi:hypothetical protein
MAIPTLGQIHRPPGWVWVYCTRYVSLCQHRAPMALAPLIIRWGPDTSSDMLRRCARCTKCGHKGATMQGPGWKDGEVEWEPFPQFAPPEAPSIEAHSGRQEFLFD